MNTLKATPIKTPVRCFTELDQVTLEFERKSKHENRQEKWEMERL